LNNVHTFEAIQAFCQNSSAWQTIAGVVMPDHFHGLIRPQNDRDSKPSAYSAALKRFVSKRIDATWEWQEGVFDRLLRKNEFVDAKWHYIRENPVRAGLVKRWEDWPYMINGQM
jgi:putative transposase